MANKNKTEFIPESEAMQLTGYSRMTLYKYRKSNTINWTAAKSGQKVRYAKPDLLKLLGLPEDYSHV